jgi:thiamine biosynthesis lipoprotein
VFFASARAAALLAGALLLSGGCPRDDEPEPVVERRVLMGTEVTVTAWDPARTREEAAAAVDQAFGKMASLESVLSRHGEDTELSRMNRAAGKGPFKVSEDLWNVIDLAAKAWSASGGAFDPTVGPLVLLWVQAGKENRLPTEAAIEQARARTGFRKIAVDPAERTAALPEGFSLDLGGIAKGYIVDQAAKVLRAAGVANGVVEAGGDLFAFGTRPDGGPWRIGIQDPAAGEGVGSALVDVLAVTGRGVTTSGHYRRFTTIEGKRYSHILDPRTGRPVEQTVLSVTVVAPDAATADGLSTAVAVLGVEKGLALVEARKDAEALLLVAGKDGKAEARETEGLAAFRAK